MNVYERIFLINVSNYNFLEFFIGALLLLEIKHRLKDFHMINTLAINYCKLSTWAMLSQNHWTD